MDTDRFFWPILAIKSNGVVKTEFSVSMETFRWIFFAKLTTWCFFEYRVKNFRLAVRQKSAELSSCFLLLHGNFLKKKLLKSFCISCGPFFRSFPVIEQEKSGRPVKTAFFVSIKTLWKKTVLENNWNFSSISDTEQEIFGFFSSFSTGSWSCILRVQGNILTENGFVSKVFSFLFWTLCKFFEQFSKKK